MYLANLNSLTASWAMFRSRQDEEDQNPCMDFGQERQPNCRDGVRVRCMSSAVAQTEDLISTTKGYLDPDALEIENLVRNPWLLLTVADNFKFPANRGPTRTWTWNLLIRSPTKTKIANIWQSITVIISVFYSDLLFAVNWSHLCFVAHIYDFFATKIQRWLERFLNAITTFLLLFLLLGWNIP